MTSLARTISHSKKTLKQKWRTNTIICESHVLDDYEISDRYLRRRKYVPICQLYLTHQEAYWVMCIIT